MEVSKSYYAILPANVRYDKRLTPNAKLLYSEITALCNDKGYCWATNKYFADLYGVSTVSISKWISQLCEFGYLNSEIIYKDGTKEILNRYLRIVSEGIKEKFNTPIKEKFKDNNTSINNKINNKIPFDVFWDLYGKKINSKDSKLKWDKLSLADQEKIIDTLPNFKKGKDYQYLPNPTTYLNQQRWNDEIVSIKQESTPTRRNPNLTMF